MKLKKLKKMFLVFLLLIFTAILSQAQTNQAAIDDKILKVKINIERIQAKLDLAEVSSKEDAENLLREIETLRNENESLRMEIKSLRNGATTVNAPPRRADRKAKQPAPIAPREAAPEPQPPVVPREDVSDARTPPPRDNTNSNALRSLDDATPQNPPIGASSESCFWVLNESNPTAKFTRDRINLCDIARTLAESDTNQLLINADTSGLGIVFAAEIVRKFGVPTEFDKERDLAAFIIGAEKKRTDKQIGANSDSRGTTSLAVKGGAPSVIGWAVENGAATQTVSGTTVTVRVNPLGLSQSLMGQGFVESGTSIQNDSFAQFLKKTSVAFSFDTMRGNETPTFVVSQQQLSAVSFRYQFINDRDPRNSKYLKLWDEFYDKNQSLIRDATINLEQLRDTTASVGTFKNPVLKKWLADTNVELLKVDRSKFREEWLLVDELARVLNQQISVLPVEEVKNDRQTYDALTGFLAAYRDFVTAKNAVFAEVRKGTVATFEYTNNREVNAPDTSNLRFIWEKGVFRNTDFTFNASVTMYNKKPAVLNIRRLRDFQFALQFDMPLENTFGLGDSVLSFAGRYERLNSDAVNEFGTVTPNSKGDIALGQLKLTIPIADFGIRLPLSVTFANRSELIKESTIRGNFGITFDLDPLFARFKPF